MPTALRIDLFFEISGKSHSRCHCQFTAVMFSAVILLAKAAEGRKGDSGILSLHDLLIFK